MSANDFLAVAHASELREGQRMVLLIVASLCDQHGICYADVDTIAEEANYTRRHTLEILTTISYRIPRHWSRTIIDRELLVVALEDGRDVFMINHIALYANLSSKQCINSEQDVIGGMGSQGGFFGLMRELRSCWRSPTPDFRSIGQCSLVVERVRRPKRARDEYHSPHFEDAEGGIEVINCAALLEPRHPSIGTKTPMQTRQHVASIGTTAQSIGTTVPVHQNHSSDDRNHSSDALCHEAAPALGSELGPNGEYLVVPNEYHRVNNRPLTRQIAAPTLFGDEVEAPITPPSPPRKKSQSVAIAPRKRSSAPTLASSSGKRQEKDKVTKPLTAADRDATIVAEYLQSVILEINPTHLCRTYTTDDPTMRKWIGIFRSMVERQGRTYEDIKAVIAWIATKEQRYWHRCLAGGAPTVYQKFDDWNTDRLSAAKYGPGRGTPTAGATPGNTATFQPGTGRQPQRPAVYTDPEEAFRSLYGH